MTTSSPEKLEITIQHVTDPEVFSNGYVAVEKAAFAGGALDLMHPPHPLRPSSEELAAFSASGHRSNLANDPSVCYCVATLPDGRIVGTAKWNFFLNDEPQYPWPTKYAPGANEEFIRWFFGQVDEKRNEGLKGKKHALMAILAIHPDYQKMGIGGKLLEWGLDRCDREGLECWIDASEKGKGLYLKYGWVHVDSVILNLEDWGGEKGATSEVACMVRQPKPVSSLVNKDI